MNTFDSSRMTRDEVLSHPMRHQRPGDCWQVWVPWGSDILRLNCAHAEWKDGVMVLTDTNGEKLVMLQQVMMVVDLKRNGVDILADSEHRRFTTPRFPASHPARTTTHIKEMADGRQIDVLKLHEIMAARPREATTWNMRQLTYPPRTPQSGYSEKRYRKVNIRQPLVVTGAGEIVDGRHRFFKKTDRGYVWFAALIVTEDELVQAELPADSIWRRLSLDEVSARHD